MSWLTTEAGRQLERARQVVSGLLKPAVFSETAPLAIVAHHVPGEPIGFAEAEAATFQPFSVGDRWGARWGTTWFRMTGEVPATWEGAEVVARVELGPRSGVGFGTEGLVWMGGAPVQGLSPNHRFVRIAQPASGTEMVDLYVEAASNPPADGSLLMPDPGGPPMSHLDRAELAVRHPEMAALVLDVELLIGLVEHLPRDEPRAMEVLQALVAFCGALDPADVRGSAAAARERMVGVLGRPAVPSAHTILAAGHAHIDTAWLWPLRETQRKCARSFSTAVTLMDEFPDYTFVCSQAVQHAWMKDRYPALFERMQKKAAAGQFEPVGSMWVEPDCNVPSGESLVRQLVFGKRFFLDAYGVETRDVWLPDVFGYSASMPQLMKLAGVEWFLTQKISWNDTNRFPHHTFWWEGIDGTRIFSHFPPSDTYNGEVTPAELIRTSRSFKDHGHATMSLLPFGFGDGGGGPTREHIERARRSADVEGLPKVRVGGVVDFFEAAVDDAVDLPIWVGELYLEYHRGTYTTQARTKLGNRRGELALREAELWSALADGLVTYPAATIDEAWRTLLVNQFHDILPGSSIHWVYDDAQRDHAGVLTAMRGVIDEAVSALATTVDTSGLDRPVVVFNALSHDRTEVVDVGGSLHVVSAPALGYTAVSAADPPPPADPVTVTDRSLENGQLRVELDDDGLLTSVWDKVAGREVLAEGQRANVLQLFVDKPNQYDAWDIERFYADAMTELVAVDTIEVVGSDPHRGAIRVRRSFGRSTLEQVVSLDAGSRRLDFATTVDWRERHRLLKVAFPVGVHSPRATYEIQYGHVERPTHANTSWDWARFEVCAQTWADLAEPDYGVALLNDCKYGYDIAGNVMRLSLLRSPTAPDPEADQGEHAFTYSLFPHAGDLRRGGVIEAAHALNSPLRVVPASGASAARPSSASLLGVDRAGVIVGAVKRADDGDDLIVRLYEAYGQRHTARLETGRPIQGVAEVDLLERPLTPLLADGSGVVLTFRPFEIKTLRIQRG
jgi:alpha-mannosidase